MSYDRRMIYQLERASIRVFVESCAEHLAGRVLDYGCGKQPYRDVVEKAGGEYVPWDREQHPGGSGGNIGGQLDRADTVLSTQVIEYIEEPVVWLCEIAEALLKPGGVLVLTGPGCWHEEEAANLHSFTKTGITRLLTAAGFNVERVTDRAVLDLGGFPMSIGWGAVARA